MQVDDRLRALIEGGARRIPRQPTPRLWSSEPEPVPPPSGHQELSILHLLDLRHRYREELAPMRTKLVGLHAALEDHSRRLWQDLTAGQAVSPKLRARCDALVVEIERAERDLADAHLAIEGVGQEIAALVAARQRQ